MIVTAETRASNSRLLEVRRPVSDGPFEDIGAGLEDGHSVVTEIEGRWYDEGELQGWGPFTNVYRVVDCDGLERWFFAR